LPQSACNVPVRIGRVIILPFSPTAPPDPAAALLVLAILLHPSAMWLPTRI
jgi:hypothetical protein